MIYIACPYTHRDPDVALWRIEQATLKEIELLNDGEVVYNPLRVSAGVAGRVTPPSGWREYDLNVLDFCSEMLVVCLPGWEESQGVKLEIQRAKKKSIPIKYEESWIQ